MHAALMSQVLKGCQLNRVDPEKRNAARPAGPAANAQEEYLVCRYFPVGNVYGADPLTP